MNIARLPHSRQSAGSSVRIERRFEVAFPAALARALTPMKD